MKTAPARRRGKVLPFQKPKNSCQMTRETLLAMKPVYDLLKANGIDWQSIPESEFAIAAQIWRLNRISRGAWSVDWQADGQEFMLTYARNHRWYDPEVVEQMIDYERRSRLTRKPGDLTEAQMNSMTHEEWLEWEASTVE